MVISEQRSVKKRHAATMKPCTPHSTESTGSISTIGGQFIEAKLFPDQLSWENLSHVQIVHRGNKKPYEGLIGRVRNRTFSATLLSNARPLLSAVPLQKAVQTPVYTDTHQNQSYHWHHTHSPFQMNLDFSVAFFGSFTFLAVTSFQLFLIRRAFI